MTHFTHLVYVNKPKNALQRSVLRLLEASDALLISDTDHFIADLKCQILDLNNQHPRCRPLILYTDIMSTPGNIGISLGDFFTVAFEIYRVKGER